MTQKTSHWISVEDRLPEGGQTVWFVVYGRVCSGKFRRGRFEEDGDDWIYTYLPSEVTHWMPLDVPEPPEEE